MDNKLVDKLKWCKRELAGLKIAYERGIGAVNFFSETSNNTLLFEPSTPALKITVQFGDVDYQPYCQCYISMPQYFQRSRIYFDNENNQLICIYMSYITNISLEIDVKAIASADMESITLEAIPYA